MTTNATSGQETGESDTNHQPTSEAVETVHTTDDWALVVRADGAVEARSHWPNGDPKTFTTAPAAEAPEPSATYRYGLSIEGVLAWYTDETRFDPDPTFNPDAETVTEAWKGTFISAQWGYGQTNVELAQIVEVSDTGKTVLARKVGAERIEHTEGSEYLRPTPDQYGDEFRLHVRDGIDDEPKFRGSYPLGSDGDMNDGPTHRGWFYPFDNDPEATVRQTDPYHRH